MHAKPRWGALLAAWIVLVPGMAFGQLPGQAGFGQHGEDYAPPDTVFPLPLYSTHPEAGGLFVDGGFWYERQTNPIKNQQVAVRGFVATNDNVLGVENSTGTFIGSGEQALNVRQVSGPNSYQPGFIIEAGWKFSDGSAVTFGYRRLTETLYNATATLFPLNFQVGNNLQNTFLTAFVFNFPNDFAGPAFKVASAVPSLQTTFTLPPSVGQPPSGNTSFIVLPNTNGQDVLFGAAGIWNGAAEMEISFIQRFVDYYITYRVPVLDTECYRCQGLVGPRATWIWERFWWRTVDLDLAGISGPQDTAIYTNIVSNYMYGVFIGSQQEWYWGHGFAGMLDLRATAYVDIVKERARYELGTKYTGVANKRARRDYTIVPEVEGLLSVMWYPIEGVQIQVGYNAMAFFNTISSPRPISFNYSSLDPAYESTFRIFDGFQAQIALSF